MAIASKRPLAPKLKRGVVVLAAEGELTNIVVNGLTERLGATSLSVILEPPESKTDVIRRRARLVGWISTAGQIAFGILQRLLWSNAARIDAICRGYNLNREPIARLSVFRVPSVNSQVCRDLLRELQPAVVAVYGTRIVSRATLQSVNVPFINYHAGINPKYRGQHPGYWALANDDPDHAGITVHLVDEGVDTGAVLYQMRVQFADDDTIASYQYVQAAYAIALFARAILDALAGRLKPRHVDLPSQKYFPPTLWGYLSTGLKKGVW